MPVETLKNLLRPMAHLIREFGVYSKLVRKPGRRKTVVMFPSDVRQMSAMLRGYNMADFLEQWGWRVAVVPMQLGLPARKRILRVFGPDLIYFQSSRHILNDPTHYPDQNLVYDIDDADFFDDKLTARIAQTCKIAKGVTAGSRFVAEWCGQHNDDVTIIWTGTPPSQMTRPPHGDRAPIITWAQSHPSGYPNEFRFVCGLMKDLRQRTDKPFSLRLYGWQDGDDMAPIEDLRAAGIEVDLLPFMTYDAFIPSLTDAAIGLCPLDTESEFSNGKSFGKILGYLDAKVPVIASDMADHSLFFTDDFGVISDDRDLWLETILRLLNDPEARQRMADQAYAEFSAQLTDQAAAKKLDACFNRLIAKG